MNPWYFYLAAAIATGLIAWYSIFWPLVKSACDAELENEFTAFPKLCSFVFIVMNIIFAPLTFITLVHPSFNQRTKDGLTRVILRDGFI